MELKKTPLYESVVAAGAKMVPFAGFHMPVQFEGIVAEHTRVRTAVGLFDVSHMGEISIVGPRAAAFADEVVSNSVAKLAAGQICYTVACNERGKVLDDLLVYRFSSERILFIVNAVNVEKIFEHLRSIGAAGVEILNQTSEIGQIAVQGPRSRELMQRVAFAAPVRERIADLAYYWFVSYALDGEEIVISRTGYTGELGYEIYLPAERTAAAWRELMDAGIDLGVGPIGLGARDTLRFEPCFCLYGHELDEETSPLEAGLSWLVKLNKERFIGLEALRMEKERGSARRLVGLEPLGRQIARQGFRVFQNDSDVGAVTSGTFAPTLQRSLALALIRSDSRENAGPYAVDVRGKRVEVKLAPIPFYPSRAAK
jgi:aminomethyltransferase